MRIFSLILKVFSFYFTVIAFFTIFKGKKYEKEDSKKSFAVLIAARNEEAVIEETVKSLLNQNYPKELFDIFVIPNNCTDKTEERAKSAGAKIIRCKKTVKNKGDALNEAVEELKNSKYDVFCVFDADNIVDREFLSKMNDVFCKGAKIAKGKQRAMNPYDSWVSGCYDIYFELFNVFFNRPRKNIGLSAKLVGTGFAFSRLFINEIGGWNTQTFAEDAEFSSQCALFGEKIWWVPEAVTYDEEPISFKTSLIQRKRWSSGVMEVAKLKMFTIIKTINRKNIKYCIDFIFFIISPFIQVLSLIPTSYYILESIYRGKILETIIMGVGLYVLMVLGVSILTLALGKRKIKILKSSILFPIFLLSWIPLNVISLFRKTDKWQQIVHHKREKHNI